MEYGQCKIIKGFYPEKRETCADKECIMYSDFKCDGNCELNKETYKKIMNDIKKNLQ